MRLTELEPRWFSVGGSNEIGGISFLCPHCKTARLGVRTSHETPHVIGVGYDDEITHLPAMEQVWQISGEVPQFDGENHSGFERVTLTPSVDASKSGHWHGFITNGEVT